jgi:integrase
VCDGSAIQEVELKLTETKILKLTCPPGKKDVLVSDDEQRGLYIRVSSSASAGKAGGRTYLAQYTFAGQKRRIPLVALTLAQARSAAAEIMGDVARGLDPAGARKAAEAEAKRKAAHVELTLEGLIEKWIKLGVADKRESYVHECRRALRRAFGKHLPLPAAGLTRKSVIAVLDDLTLGGSPIMSRQTARYGSACFAWAVKREDVKANPFANVDVPAAVERDRVLTNAELREVWQATAAPGSLNSIVRLLMLTGQRLSEVAELPWSELSGDLSTWTLPPGRAKNGVAHTIPLSPQARAIIEAAPRYAGNLLVFPGARGALNSWGRAKDRLHRDSGTSGWTLHDLRRTVATNMQKLGVRLEVAEAILNHVGGSRAGIVGVYQRHTWDDEKRAALNAWADRLEAIVEGREAAGNVTPIRAAVA